MRWRLMFITLIVLLAALPALAWLSAPWWLPLVAKRQLAGHGFAVKAMQIERPGWHETHLKQLHLRQPEGGVEIKLRGLTAAYDLARLLDGRLDELDIDWLQLQLHPSPGQSGSAGMVLLAPAPLLASIPVTHMQISDMSIRRLDSQGRLLQLLVGQAELQGGSIAVELKEPASDNPLQAQFKLDTRGLLQANLMQGHDPIIRLESLIHEEGDQFAVQSEVHVELAALDQLASQWLGIPAFRLQGELNGRWQTSLPNRVSLEPEKIIKQLMLNGSFSLDAGSATADSADSMNIRLDSEIEFASGKGSWKVAESSRLQLGTGRKKQIIRPSGLSGGFQLAEDGWQVSLNQGGKVSTDTLRVANLSLAGASISLIKPVHLSPAADGGLQLDSPAIVAARLPVIRSGKNSLVTRGVRLTLNAGPLAAQRGRFAIAGLKLATDTVEIPELSLSGSFNLAPKRLAAAGTLASTDGQIRMNWHLAHKSIQGQGKLSYSLQPLLLGVGGMDIAQLLDSRDEYGVQAGQLSGAGETTWKSGKGGLRLDHHLNLELTSLAGFYKENSFSGLNGQLRVDMAGETLKLASDHLLIDEFNTGIPIRNLAMNTMISYPFTGAAKVSIGHLRGEALGGTVNSERIDVDFARASNPFTIQLKQIDARQIAEIRKQEGLYADGILDGVLPFDWTRDGLRLIQGKLQARSPGGVIQYLGTESIRSLATTDRSTKMALDILSDLRYRQLRIGLNARPDGEMTLRIELKGHNPGYENGRPIEFNLNIEENILKLLYSLRMADEIGGRLEKQMQKKLQKR